MSLYSTIAILPIALVLVLLIRLLGRSCPVDLSDAHALRAMIARDHPSFDIGLLLIGRDGASVLALESMSGDGLLLFRLGARVVAWRLAAGRLAPPHARYDADGDRLVIDTGEPTRRQVALLLPHAPPEAAQFRRALAT